MSSVASAATLDDVEEGQHVLCVLDETGDTKLSWDPDNRSDVEDARKMFDDLKKKGYTAYSVRSEKRDVRGEVIRSFDPSAEKIIMSPPMQGG